MELSRSHHWVILLAAVLISLFTLLRIFYSSRTDRDQETALIEPLHEMAVEIKGMVSRPGIYFLPSGSRLNDLLKDAGFISQKAALSPWQKGLPLGAGNIITLLLDRKDRIAVSIRPMEPRKLFFLNLPIDVNAATKKDLMVIPGIGPKTARAIVSYRTRWGPFSGIADLEKVSGLGRKRVRRLSKYLKVYQDTSAESRTLFPSISTVVFE